MMTKYVVAGAVVTALMFSAAQAQTPQPTTKTESSSAGLTQAYKGQWRINKMIGLDVYNRQNQKLGDIFDILIDPAGKVQTVILGVGGFLGVGERLVAVSFDKLEFVAERIEPKSAAGSAPSPAAPKTAAESNATSTTGSAATARPARTAEQQWYPDHAVIDVTADDLKAMSQFKFN